MAPSGTAQHPNAALTPGMRREMVDLVVARGWSPSAVAGRFRATPETVRKRCARFRSEGAAGLADRSSRPRRSPNRTSGDKRAQAVGLRRQRRCGGGPDRPRGGPGPVDCAEHLEPHRAGPVRPRRPGRGPPRGALSARNPRRAGTRRHEKAGRHLRRRRVQSTRPRPGDRYCCLHTALDDRTRLACSEIPADEKPPPQPGSGHAPANGSPNSASPRSGPPPTTAPACRSRLWAQALKATGTTHKTTRPRWPQTNRKAERPHHTPTEEQALHPTPDNPTTTHHRPHRIHPPPQPPPTPPSTQPEHPKPHPHTTPKQGQPPQRAHLE